MLDNNTKKNIEINFFKSAVTLDSKITPNSEIENWINYNLEKNKVRVTQVPLDQMQKWTFDNKTGDLLHESGKFFSIEGIQIETNWSYLTKWEQPIINQSEIGYLGILVQKKGEILHFLMQAKIEPGNINKVQISPTLQSTKSNYSRVHGGRKPLFLEYFNGDKKARILLDQLQSEQGARFLRKRNRNIIIEIDENEDINLPENFIWLTLGQIKRLTKIDNLINMDTRTVISGIPFGSNHENNLIFFHSLNETNKNKMLFLNSAINSDVYLNHLHEIISWITSLKADYHLTVTRKSLNKLLMWDFKNGVILHKENKYFSVIGVNVTIANREVGCWDQPMIKSCQEGLIAFIVKNIKGIYHFLVQAKLESGNFDVIELAPTVQCLTGNYRVGYNEYTVPFINEIINAKPGNIIYSALQSEEGGRFYHEQNRNMIVEVGDEFPIAVPEKYCWMTLNQLYTFLTFNNYLNIAARSLISAIEF